MSTPTTEATSAFRSKMLDVVNKIHAAPSTRDIILHLTDEIRGLFSAERMTIYALDTQRQQLYSIAGVGAELKEIRVPKSFASIAGFCGLSRQPVNVPDAYDAQVLQAIHPQLRFDPTWDKKSGFRTKQVLAVPILFDKYLLGVVQLVNRPGDGKFSSEEVAGLQEVAKTLGIAFYNQRKSTATTKPSRYAQLVASGAVSEQDIQAAATEARANGCSVDKILLDRHGVDKAELLQSLSKFYAVPSWSYSNQAAIPEDLEERLNVDFLRKNHWVPVGREGRHVLVAVDDPQDLTRLDAIQATNLAPRVEYLVALREDILQLLDETFGGEDEEDDEDLFGDLDDLVQVDEDEESEGGPDEQDSEVVRLANQIIRDAYRTGVSDIHVEPYGDRDKTVVRFRQDGRCKVYKQISPELRNALVSRLKIMARLDISEKRKPQDGKIRFQGKKGGGLELRVATIPTAGGNEDVVMRILAGSEPLPLEKMGFSERNLREFQAVVQKPYGIILVVGPTGSGKTTTLHSALGFINQPDRKIWTAEDPVEITQKGLRQVQVHPKIGFDFAAAMRAFLRADPDVIMVGEMRDRETAQMGIEASLTGHIVFSTLHTNSASETITRLLDMEIDPFSFADALLAILAQRLLRTLCKECKEGYVPEQQELQDLVDGYGREWFPKSGIKLTTETQLMKPKGCKKCADSGFRGRMAIHELIVSSDSLKDLILQKAPVSKIHEQAMKDGMTTLMQDGVAKVIQGHTTLAQVRSVCMK
jgi:type II secretory ATPase GspE/PulE/Tfp pilus assembly ATPase PilB-like protein